MKRTFVSLIAVGFLVSCAVADEDELAACERQVKELEAGLSDCMECDTKLAKALYEAERYKEQAEGCIDKRIKGKRK